MMFNSNYSTVQKVYLGTIFLSNKAKESIETYLPDSRTVSTRIPVVCFVEATVEKFVASCYTFDGIKISSYNSLTGFEIYCPYTGIKLIENTPEERYLNFYVSPRFIFFEMNEDINEFFEYANVSELVEKCRHDHGTNTDGKNADKRLGRKTADIVKMKGCKIRHDNSYAVFSSSSFFEIEPESTNCLIIDKSKVENPFIRIIHPESGKPLITGFYNAETNTVVTLHNAPNGRVRTVYKIHGDIRQTLAPNSVQNIIPHVGIFERHFVRTPDFYNAKTVTYCKLFNSDTEIRISGYLENPHMFRGQDFLKAHGINKKDKRLSVTAISNNSWKRVVRDLEQIAEIFGVQFEMFKGKNCLAPITVREGDRFVYSWIYYMGTNITSDIKRLLEQHSFSSVEELYENVELVLHLVGEDRLREIAEKRWLF